jgi:hypothetical protein
VQHSGAGAFACQELVARAGSAGSGPSIRRDKHVIHCTFLYDALIYSKVYIHTHTSVDSVCDDDGRLCGTGGRRPGDDFQAHGHLQGLAEGEITPDTPSVYGLPQAVAGELVAYIRETGVGPAQDYDERGG